MRSMFCILLLLVVSVQAWVPPLSHIATPSRVTTQRTPFLQSTPTDESEADEEEQVVSLEAEDTVESEADEPEGETDEEEIASFTDAGRLIIEEENKEMIANMERDQDDEDFEERNKEYEAIRQAIRERTKDLGIEKSVLQEQLIADAERRAAAGEQVTGLDLSQITGGLQTPIDAPVDEDEEIGKLNLPTLADDLEAKFKKLSPEERKAIDPTDGMNPFQQALVELKEIDFPTPMAAIKEVVLLLAVVAVFSVIIINWDHFLKEKFMELDIIPRPGEITQQFEGLKLPEGWTDGLTDQDVVSVPEVSGSGSSITDVTPPAGL